MDRLRAALDAMAARGEAAAFWLRDDDATEPSAALDRLLAPGVPMTIAARVPGEGSGSRPGVGPSSRVSGRARSPEGSADATVGASASARPPGGGCFAPAGADAARWPGVRECGSPLALRLAAPGNAPGVLPQAGRLIGAGEGTAGAFRPRVRRPRFIGSGQLPRRAAEGRGWTG